MDRKVARNPRLTRGFRSSIYGKERQIWGNVAFAVQLTQRIGFETGGKV
jgi:hypothetical protein